MTVTAILASSAFGLPVALMIAILRLVQGLGRGIMIMGMTWRWTTKDDFDRGWNVQIYIHMLIMTPMGTMTTPQAMAILFD